MTASQVGSSSRRLICDEAFTSRPSESGDVCQLSDVGRTIRPQDRMTLSSHRTFRFD